MEKYGVKLNILLSQKIIITHMIMIKHTWKSNLIQMISYLWKKVVIVIRSVFNDNNKYYPQVILDECLYKLAEN